MKKIHTIIAIIGILFIGGVIYAAPVQSKIAILKTQMRIEILNGKIPTVDLSIYPIETITPAIFQLTKEIGGKLKYSDEKNLFIKIRKDAKKKGLTVKSIQYEI